MVSIVGLDEVLDLISRMPDHLYNTAKENISESVLSVHSQVSSYSGGLRNRSGILRRSLKTDVGGNTLDTLHGDVYTDVVYAPIQEKGGTVRAKNAYKGVPGGPYLNIPLPANKTPAGVMRMNAREVFSSRGYIIKSRLGKYIVMSGNNQPMFVLKKEVHIPARLGMVDAAVDEIPTLLNNLRNTLLEGL